MSVITHNINAMNTQRQLKINSKDKKKASEKLASGYKINRSADDAAGLAISEKMRWQIRGLNKASRNIQDGMSLIQTADGALGQIHDILQRMNELSTQAANDTNTAADRDAVQLEVLQLNTEINRIARTTQFNSQNILVAAPLVLIDTDDYSAVKMDDSFQGMGNPPRRVYGKTVDFSNINSANKEKLIDKKFFVTCSENCNQIFTFEFTDQADSKIELKGRNLTVQIGLKDASLANGSDIAGKINDLVVGKQADFQTMLNSPTYLPNWTNKYNDTVIGHANALSRDGGKLTFYSITSRPPYAPGMGLIYATDLLEEQQEFLLQVSDRPFVQIALNLKTITTGTLGVGVPNVSSYEDANRTMDSVQNAINNLSRYRSYLGAMQNRLEKTKSVVDNTAENAQYSESQLRDTAMEEEAVKLFKSNILEQFGEAMLAQAKHKNEDVLQLLE